MKDELISAAIVQFEAQRRRAEANLRVFLDYPVGIPEHPDSVAEVIAMTKIIAEAIECINVLKGLQD
jgi:hypothetical protein